MKNNELKQLLMETLNQWIPLMVRCFDRLSITTNGINNLPFVLSPSTGSGQALSKDLFVSALEDGLKNNHAAEQLAKLDAPIKQLQAIFDTVKTAKIGDVI